MREILIIILAIWVIALWIVLFFVCFTISFVLVLYIIGYVEYWYNKNIVHRINADYTNYFYYFINEYSGFKWIQNTINHYKTKQIGEK